MNTGTLFTSIVLLAAGGLAAAAGKDGIDAANMGLSKTSVFDTPTPEPFAYSDTKAGKSAVLPRAYPDIPPQIPHKIDTYLPITAEDNQCLDCHDKPNLIGKKNTRKSPMSREHYVDLRGSDNEMMGEIVGARFNCTQCHVPQSGAPALVENTFEVSD
jgi:cytochrome c-type protein NapB